MSNQSDTNHENLRNGLKDPALCLGTAWEIRQLGPNPEMVEPLLEALKTCPDMAFGMVMSALATMQDQRAFEPILGYLKSPNSYHRGLAAQALGTLGDQRAIKHLEEMLGDAEIAWKEDYGPERSVAQLAQAALGRLKSGA